MRLYSGGYYCRIRAKLVDIREEVGGRRGAVRANGTTAYGQANGAKGRAANASGESSKGAASLTDDYNRQEQWEREAQRRQRFTEGRRQFGRIGRVCTKPREQRSRDCCNANGDDADLAVDALDLGESGCGNGGVAENCSRRVLHTMERKSPCPGKAGRGGFCLN